MVSTSCLNEYQIDVPADADNVVRFDVEVDDAIVVHEHNSGDNLFHRIGDFNYETKIWNYHQVLISRDMTRNLLSEHSALILSEPVLLAADSLEQLSSLFIKRTKNLFTF